MTPVEPPQDPYGIPPEYRILDAIDLGILLVGEGLTVIRANTAFRRLAGGEPAEVPGEVAGRVRAAAGDGIPEFECRLRAPDGGERRCRCSGRRAPSGEGWLLFFRKTPNDYEDIVEYTGTATILIEGDGTISVANTEFERLSGYSRGEIAGAKQLTEFVASDDERLRLTAYHALRRREPGAAPTNYSFSFVDRSGSIHDVEATIGLIPGTARSVMSLLDATGRRRADLELRIKGMAMASALDIMILVDLDGRITYVNRALLAMYGSAREEEVVGQPASVLWADPGEMKRVWQVVLRNGAWSGEMEARRQDGSTFPMHLAISIVTDESGRSLCAMGSGIDITGLKLVEQELRIKDMAIASSLDAISLTGLDRRITYVNRAFLTMHGWEREEEVIGQPASVLWADPDEAERVIETFHRDGTWLGEVEGRRWDGSTFPMQLALSPVTDESGRRICTMGSGIDITRRKEVEQELRIKDMAIASSPSAFSIADLDGRHTYVNQAFLSLWGYNSPSEVIGRSVAEFWQDGRILTGTGRYTGERIGKRRDGTTFCAMFSGNVVTDDAGVPIGFAASLTDITGLKRAKAEVQAHNRMLSVLNQIIGVSISATDIDEMLEDVLAATLALLDLPGGGIYLVEPEGRSARLACAQDLPEGFPLHRCIPDITVSPFSEVLVAGEPLFFDETETGEGRLPPCAVIPLLAHERVVGALNLVNREDTRFIDADRSLLTAIGSGIGSSIERTMLIRQLEMAEREANLYLDILGHDIRNAENTAGLYADLLIDTLTGEEKEYAEKVRSSIRKSVEILRNVSTIRRIHHESTGLVPVDLDEVIRGEIAIFSGCRIRYGGTDLPVMADALLPEVFTNLIGNAVKFGGPAVEIAIRVEERGGDVGVVVEDTGPGVPDDMKEAVFMRFGPNKGRKSGQGLGLSITRMLVERYGGWIRVDDRIPGRPECGAAFRFTLKKA